MSELRNEIKSYIVRSGRTMQEIVTELHDTKGWSSSVPNFTNKLERGSFRYTEAKDVAEVLGLEIVWQKKAE